VKIFYIRSGSLKAQKGCSVQIAPLRVTEKDGIFGFLNIVNTINH